MRATVRRHPAPCRSPATRTSRRSASSDPPIPTHGDWASNVALQLAPVARAAPIRIAETLLEHFEPPASVAEVSVAAPGFLNFRLDPGWLAAQVGPIRDAGPAYGRGTASTPQRINVEFVSANPTGPLTVGNARGAFVGDVLSRVLEAVGHDVTREYYFNDFNEQIRNLGLTVLSLKRGEPIPDDGYRGEYVNELVAAVPDELWARADAPDADPAELLGRWAAERVRSGIEASLGRLGVGFDVWTSEGAIHEAGWVERVIAQLQRRGLHVHRWGRALVQVDRLRRRQGSGRHPLEWAADLLRC